MDQMPRGLVLIEWEDSAQPTPAWQHSASLQRGGVVRCQSVGFLLHEGKDVMILAPNIGDISTDNEQVSGIIRIPTRSIVRQLKLRVTR